MRDDINRVKGEQGKPTFSPGSLSPSSDISSEHERTSGHREPPRRGPKKETLRIDRTEGCQLAPTVLPPEAELKGDERVVIQDVRVETDNIAFQKEVYQDLRITPLSPPVNGGKFAEHRVKALPLACGGRKGGDA